MQRTIRLPLKASESQRSALMQTMHLYTACFNKIVAYAWENSVKNGVELHKATYYSMRTEYPQLPAQLVISSRSKATEAVKSALTWKSKHEKEFKRQLDKAKGSRKHLLKFEPVHCPYSHLMSIRYDEHTYSIRGNHVSLSTAQGRQLVDLHFYPYALRLFQQSLSFDSADLVYKKQKFWLHLVVTLPDVKFSWNGKKVGVDFGITRPAVASNNQFFGERRWKAIEQKYFHMKRVLQSKGTKSSKRHLQKLSGRATRFRTDCDHVVSKRLIQSVIPGTLIVIEDLRNITVSTKQSKKQQKRAMHEWSFRRLATLISYKAEMNGCQVVEIDPRYTSQTCSRCGFVHQLNRRSRSVFECRNCGFELHADLNASRNIQHVYHARFGKSESGGPMPTSPL